LIYIENRRLITRAPDQIEDIKLVIEFWLELDTFFQTNNTIRMCYNAPED
jgi:hypothetical protein